MIGEGLRPMAQRGFFIACVLAVVSEALASSLPGVPGTVPAPPVARAWPLANAFSGWVWEQVVPGKNSPLWGYIAFQEPDSSCLRLLKVLGLKSCLARLCGFLESSCAFGGWGDQGRVCVQTGRVWTYLPQGSHLEGCDWDKDFVGEHTHVSMHECAGRRSALGMVPLTGFGGRVLLFSWTNWPGIFLPFSLRTMIIRECYHTGFLCE